MVTAGFGHWMRTANILGCDQFSKQHFVGVMRGWLGFLNCSVCSERAFTLINHLTKGYNVEKMRYTSCWKLICFLCGDEREITLTDFNLRHRRSCSRFIAYRGFLLHANSSLLIRERFSSSCLSAKMYVRKADRATRTPRLKHFNVVQFHSGRKTSLSLGVMLMGNICMRLSG